MNMKSTLTIATFCLIFMPISQPAYAYLDPGTGSMIIQGLLAGIAMAAMAIKMYWQKLIYIFNSIFRKPKSEVSDQDEF